jgi:hypothetical protein
MKRLFVMTTIAATLLAAQFLHAEPVHLSLIGSTVNAEVAFMNCTVNGVTYPVDTSYNVWAVNTFGWYVIGHLYATGNGYAIVSNSIIYNAYCY